MDCSGELSKQTINLLIGLQLAKAREGGSCTHGQWLYSVVFSIMADCMADSWEWCRSSFTKTLVAGKLSLNCRLSILVSHVYLSSRSVKIHGDTGC